ncbi:MAG TPA: BtpA/SgcQ family protein [Phycisphaerae bacterium]|nr:BtpA/SgcQ family protein [Phycisphaerae bacterium]HOJ74962.1 BtpA/SgcQ family protein [Phycisphaerae bacterium]HOM51523.1 BtpA/SgcQ family protein [Phycisphaerae bacterium]HOQ88480.1 BtpA/SgcQ family protein [Phycisphaerae bacterium]HPP27051.1 BtpA/SgcQ family protein [Phycisphaerae bacterium]
MESYYPLPPRALIGMVHLAPLPGSPASELPLARICEDACRDARTLAEAGFTAIVMENFGDAPFRATTVDPHTVAAMTLVARAIRRAVDLPLGINVLRNDAQAALAIATVCEAAFVRVNIHTGVYATDQGIIEGRADETLRYRQRLGSRVAVFADVHVKHASPLLSQSIAEAAEEAAYRGRADALIVSGTGTGKPTSLDDLRSVRDAVPDRPLLVGSGANVENIRELLAVADGVIVGTTIKENGRTTAPVDADRARTFVQAARV